MTMHRLCLAAAALAFAAIGVQADSSCTRDADGTCLEATSSALLQKAIKRDEKTTFSQEQVPSSREDNLYDTVCTGTQAQGRCWFLSDAGESCSATCARHGRSFSFIIADPDAPVTPSLVGHEPKVKQQPWAALECYAASEDRFHTANQNAARHYVNDIGTWSHENCKLACPCGGSESDRCSWREPPECAPEFMWKGVKYTGCATVDLEHERPWCQHSFQHTEKANTQDWSYCTYDCIGEDQDKPDKDTCEWLPAASCVGEFDYEGTHYVGCTDSDHDTPWCSNADPYKGSWNHCIRACPNDEDDVRPVNPIKPSNQQLCTWKPKPECAEAFEYKGVEYTGCIEQDHPTPWCSRNRVHQGEWETCTRVCSSASDVVPVRRQEPERIPTPVSSSDPCDRHPDAENDIIGNSVTLDEAGYKIAAAADSPVNMKRYVCRVIGSIGCRAVDLSALMAFVPYYSGSVSHQTHRRLEAELTTLCHAGGKWVVPRALP